MTGYVQNQSQAQTLKNGTLEVNSNELVSTIESPQKQSDVLMSSNDGGSSHIRTELLEDMQRSFEARKSSQASKPFVTRT